MKKTRQIYMKHLYYPYNDSVRGITRFKHFLDGLGDRLSESFDQEPESMFSEDWDNLLILDGCRADLYEEVTGESDTRVSLGSSSREFIEKTFSSGDYSDLVYVTANPHFSEDYFQELTGRDLDDVFHTVYHVYMDDWNHEEGTVMPSKLAEKIKSARKLFPEKRVVGHFMQPHYPFINSDIDAIGIRPDLDKDKEDESVWNLAEQGLLDDEEIWRAYRKNLELVLVEVNNLIEDEEFTGKTIVTADHGNAVGEYGVYGHPSNMEMKVLREVPWSIIN